MYGHKTNSKEHLKTAQQLFQLVGASATEYDKIQLNFYEVIYIN